MVAQERGFFEKNGLQVDLINYSGSTDQLLESIATGKADAAVGMIHPLAQAAGSRLRRQDHRQLPRRLRAAGGRQGGGGDQPSRRSRARRWA